MIKTILLLMYSFGKIGLISLGGGASMLSLIEYDAFRYHWVTSEEFAKMMGSTFLFPGLTAVKLAALIGYKAQGFAGLVVAVLALNLPALVLVIIGYRLLTIRPTPLTQKIIISAQYGGLALLAATSFSIAKIAFHAFPSVSMMLLTLLFFIGLSFFKLSPFWGLLAFLVFSISFMPKL